VRSTLERELKLDADETFVLPELGGERLESRVFTSTYHDTADGSLARVGITLRRRLENGVSLWQLKLPAAGDRLELEQHGGPVGPPEEMCRLLAAHLRHGPLTTVAQLRTRRSGVLVTVPAAAEVTLDVVSVLDGGREMSSFREIEVELRDGTRAALDEIGKALRDAGARDTNGLPKLFRVIGRPAAPATDAVHARLREQSDTILAHDPGTRLSTDPEALHDMRVATRRLRALLRTIRPLVRPGTTETLRSELGWLGRLLGDVRDLDVLLERLDHEVAELDGDDRRAGRSLLRRLERERSRRRETLLRELDGARYFALLDELQLAADSLPVDDTARLPQLAAREFRRARKAEKLAGAEPTDTALHELRKQVKHARYAAELVDRKAAARFVERAKEFQDVVGAHQDAIVAEHTLRALIGPRSPAAHALAVGRLVERERARRREARAQWRETWRRLERSGKKAWAS
jgi:CHAD domain-containing protein